MIVVVGIAARHWQPTMAAHRVEHRADEAQRVRAASIGGHQIDGAEPLDVKRISSGHAFLIMIGVTVETGNGEGIRPGSAECIEQVARAPMLAQKARVDLRVAERTSPTLGDSRGGVLEEIIAGDQNLIIRQCRIREIEHAVFADEAGDGGDDLARLFHQATDGKIWDIGQIGPHITAANADGRNYYAAATIQLHPIEHC